MTEDPIPLSPRSRFRAALILAMAADALQIFVFPSFVEGALSPADDVLDLAVAAVLVRLLGWHWEFLPAFLAELVPRVVKPELLIIEVVAELVAQGVQECSKRT